MRVHSSSFAKKLIYIPRRVFSFDDDGKGEPEPEMLSVARLAAQRKAKERDAVGGLA